MIVVENCRKVPEGLQGCSLTLQCSQVGDSAVSVLTQAEVVSNSGRKLPEKYPEGLRGCSLTL